MSKSDREFFNCSEPHEARDFARQYEEFEEVHYELNEKCITDGIKNKTHKDLHEYFASQGYTRK